MNKIVLSCLLVFFTFQCIAQKDGGMKSLLSKDAVLALPVPVKKITEVLKVKPTLRNDEIYGDEYTWKSPGGLLFTALVGEDKKAHSVFLEAQKKQVLSGLPYDLILNGSTLKDCETKFKANILEKQKLNPVDNPGETTSFILKVKNGQYYIHLAFDAKLKLEQITISTANLDAAG